MFSSPRATIEIFTTSNCPDCRALKAWLSKEGIPVVERDLADPAIAEAARRRTGVRVAPVSIVGDNVFYGQFQDQKPRIVAALGLAAAN